MNTNRQTINRTWFNNQLKKGNFLVKCDGKYTDDYAFDNSINFAKEDDFKEAQPNYFSEFKLSRIHISGQKDGIIDVNFANCEDYTFKLNEKGLKELKVKYRILSPDGFDIERSKTYNSKKQVDEALSNFVKRYEHQGYYSLSNWDRLPLDQIIENCSIINA